MKELKKCVVILAFALVSMVMAVSCHEPVPEPEPEPVVLKDYNFDLFVCAVKHGGMSQNKNGTYVRSVSDLTADQPRVEFTGKGIDITQDYTLESITRGKYYYQVPQKATGGFVKFHIERDAAGEERIVEDAEVPFKDNVYSARGSATARRSSSWVRPPRRPRSSGPNSLSRTWPYSPKVPSTSAFPKVSAPSPRQVC